jgi:hypothetical protein
MPGKNKNKLLGWHPTSADDAVWVREEAERRGGRAAGALTQLLDEALSDLRAKHAPEAAPVLAAQDGHPEQTATDQSWESAAKIAREVTSRAGGDE